MLLQACRTPRLAASLPHVWPRRFSASPIIQADHTRTHYETLGLDPGATPADIKKKFYALSKSYHPDLHPNDPTASARFVEISESYAVLGSASKRAAYDRTIAPASQQPSGPRGSYSSHTAASSPAGARPASGLSRRRTQFRGPPPSFYRSGGWGEHGAKRAEWAARGRSEHDGPTTEAGDGGGAARAEPGMGPGGFAAGFDDDVPHFDRQGHTRTHEGVERSARRRHKKGWEATSQDIAEARAAGGSFTGFLAVSGVLAIVLGLSAMLNPRMTPHGSNTADRKRRQEN